MAELSVDGPATSTYIAKAQPRGEQSSPWTSIAKAPKPKPSCKEPSPTMKPLTFSSHDPTGDGSGGNGSPIKGNHRRGSRRQKCIVVSSLALMIIAFAWRVAKDNNDGAAINSSSVGGSSSASRPAPKLAIPMFSQTNIPIVRNPKNQEYTAAAAAAAAGHTKQANHQHLSNP